MEMMKAEETRKGPWTEEEDIQLTCYVEMFGERRWDFIAKVSGLRRTGKSCRLRWVNYLHPGLKRGRMTPQEERMVVELHSRWGNRWSRIAQKLPGRTDNEIKNYWRTHMRKEAQERKRNGSYRSTGGLSSSSSSSSSSTSFVIFTQPEESLLEDIDGGFFPMEKIWDEIASSELNDPQPPQAPQSLPPLPPTEINTTTLHSPLCFCCCCLSSFPNEEDELKALICMGSSELLINDSLDGRSGGPDIFQQSTFV